MNPLRIYDYLTLARERVFDSVRPLSREQYHHAFNTGLKTLAATLAHMMISEWYYVQRLTGRAVPPYDQWPMQYETPPESFDVVERTWHEQAKATRAAIAGERDWKRPISWTSYPNEQGRRFEISVTAGDLMTQLALHEVHHRAQVMAMLRELPGAGGGSSGKPLQDLDYNALMFERREVKEIPAPSKSTAQA